MKKIVSAFFVLCLTVSILSSPITAFAASPSYTLEGKTVSPGETFTIDIGIKDNPGIISLRLSITYTEELTLLSVANKGLLNGWTAPSATVSSPYTLRWADSLATENNMANGNIITLTFKAKDTAAALSPDILISHIEARNASGVKVDFSGVSAKIKIVPKVQEIQLKPDAGLQINSGLGTLTGVNADTTAANILSQFSGGDIGIYKDGIKLKNNDLVGTGCEIRLMDGGEILDSLTIVVKGDLDGDGKVNVPDARKALRAAVKLDTISDFQSLAADVDGSGKVEVPDARLILRVAVGLQGF